MIQQRILDGRDNILKNTQIINEVIMLCDDDHIKLKNYKNELKSIKQQITNLTNNINPNMQSGSLSFASTWTNYASGYHHGMWYKIGNIVILQGLVKSSNFNGYKHIATLPKTCCPKERLIFNLDHHGDSFRVDIETNGKISWINGNAGNKHNWISLNGTIFVVE